MPENLQETPAAVVEFLAGQLLIKPDLLADYGSRSQTRTDHLSEIYEYSGFHRATEAEESEIDFWLAERALEHDRPLLLLQILASVFRRKK